MGSMTRVDTAQEVPPRTLARQALLSVLQALDDADEWPGLGSEDGATYFEVAVPELPEIDLLAGPGMVTIRVAG